MKIPDDKDRLDRMQREVSPMEIDMFNDVCFITFRGYTDLRYSAPTLREALDKAFFGGEPDKLPPFKYRLPKEQDDEQA
jgi:hypothetical protein